ncbi:MAG: TetR/AcrR family transcriptional regulator [Solirubrobacterales bacterium]|nr:TetR/AcrR family transcriptional regulator [Solirubrobacterales bacterium]MBV9942841.1 TetR/AcrR family transcriptional regulator [Solirubrobacterales bacterium]
MELPQVESGRARRIDAVRNREAILDAATRLLRDRGAAAITMDCVASEAGVGKGTLFRRFGDRAGLFHALLDESERRLQEGFIRGPAPLGPGAPPAERLIAFGQELLQLTAKRGDLFLASLPPEHGLRYRSPVYGAYRAHVRTLLEQAGVAHADYVADGLLAALDPELIMHQLGRGLSLEECQRGWATLVRTIAQD